MSDLLSPCLHWLGVVVVGSNILAETLSACLCLWQDMCTGSLRSIWWSGKIKLQICVGVVNLTIDGLYAKVQLVHVVTPRAGIYSCDIRAHLIMKHTLEKNRAGLRERRKISKLKTRPSLLSQEPSPLKTVQGTTYMLSWTCFKPIDFS